MRRSRQIDENISRATRDAILGNCGTLVVFKTAATDIELLATEFQQPFEPVRLHNLERHEAYIRHRNDPENKIRSRPLAEWNFPHYNARDHHIAQSREKYATPREKVEAARVERVKQG